MFNIFESNNEDITYIVDNFGHEVSINNKTVKAIITNNVVSEYEDRYISSTLSIKRGDIVKDSTVNYLVITESVSKRYSKYKAIMRHCNYTLDVPKEVCELIGRDSSGRPVYDCTNQLIPTPVIVDNKSFSIMEGAIRLPNNQILVTMQDNEANKTEMVTNKEFELMDSTWVVLNVDLTKNGLLLMTCEFKSEV
ncbi:Ig domain-containing protein [Fictibacillus nanhaiensis]|uniref:Ig domain-containing protein n=1 Tax=Fictibacillus nanhaiensis TaxID=742169 RepID=UPI003C18AD85